jgi:hypothetical protein
MWRTRRNVAANRLWAQASCRNKRRPGWCDLNVEAWFLKAIGFHKQSRERRCEIARIYGEHGMPLPDEQKE